MASSGSDHPRTSRRLGHRARRRRFWGRAGAAGLLVIDEHERVLLQHRVEWSHFGGTWGIPGGARQFDESAVDGAIRESVEEASVPRDSLRSLFTSVFDLGFWSYTTVVSRATRPFEPVIGDGESTALEWVPVDDVDALPLHPGFATSWEKLRPLLATPLHLVVDSANVVGSRPDGWWKDRAGANARLADTLAMAVASGFPAAEFGLGEGGLVDTWWPVVSLVVEGRGAEIADPRPGSSLRVVRAPTDGDSAIVDEVATLVGAPDAGAAPARVVVVTADRELAARVAGLGATVVGPSTALDQLR